MRSFLLITAALLAACAPDLAESFTDEEIVSPSSPYRHDVPWSVIPDLGTNGFALASWDTTTDSSATHEGTFATGRTTGRSGTTDASAWDPIARGADWADFESSPSFPAHLDEVKATASSTLGKLTDLGGLKTVLEALPLPIEVSYPAPTDAFYGWVPAQARWLRDQYVVTSPTGAMTKQVYADPVFGDEIRERGARLYCAARAASFVQGSTRQSMGRQVALAISVFGHEVDLGVVEATFALDGPTRSTGSADGAQAFEVPMLIGTSITPIDGIGLSGFGELRHPIVLTTGDSEVATAVVPQTLHVGDNFICNTGSKRPVCQTFPVYTTDSPRDYLTVTHADAFVGRSEQLDVTIPPIPLFTMGAFTVTVSGDGSVHVGTPTTPQDRLIAGAPSGWPATRAGDITGSPWTGWVYDTEPWSSLAPIESPITGSTSITGPSWFSLPAAGGYAGFAGNDPLLMRALADDDHHVSTSTSGHLGAFVNGDFGFSLGLAALELVGRGGLSIDVAHQTDVRDGLIDLMGNGSGIPTTALTVTPSTNATVGVSFSVKLHIMIDLWIDSIDEWIDIVDAGTSKTWSSAPWGQQNRVLIATGTSYGDPTNQPAIAYSHLPAPLATPATMTVFDSFAQSVPECLADSRAYSPTPQACPPSATGAAPAGNLCMFSGSWLVNVPIGNGTPGAWDGVCSDIPAHVDAILGAATADQKACYVDTLSYLCSPTSREQDWHGQHGVAHVVPVSPNGAFDLGAVATECAKAFYPVPGPETFNRIFEFGACDAGGTMIDKDAVVAPLGSTGSDPSPVTGGSCP